MELCGYESMRPRSDEILRPPAISTKHQNTRLSWPYTYPPPTPCRFPPPQQPAPWCFETRMLWGNGATICLALSMHFLRIFCQVAWCCWVFSSRSCTCPIISQWFHIFQGFFCVFSRDWILVLLIVAFPMYFVAFLGVSTMTSICNSALVLLPSSQRTVMALLRQSKAFTSLLWTLSPWRYTDPSATFAILTPASSARETNTIINLRNWQRPAQNLTKPNKTQREQPRPAQNT